MLQPRIASTACRTFAFAALLLGGCGAETRTPDILLVTIDTLRADRVGCYGNPHATTPHLDALAADGVLFTACQSPAPITLPSHASILTGLYPPEHGVRNNATYRLPADVPTLATELSGAGYRTGAFVAALPLDTRFGLDRGFDRYDAALPDGSMSLFSYRERPAGEVVEAAVSWLKELDRERPVFLWAHFFEPHAPHVPDPGVPGDAYDAEVARADRALAELHRRFAEERGREPLVVVTSDHGEGLGEHGEPSHAIFLYQTTLHVPLVIRGPEPWRGGRVVEEPVSLVDLAPTLLEAAGVETARMDATGIVLDPRRVPPRRELYSESLYGMEAYHWAPLFASRLGPDKVIRSRRVQAFDLAADPRELENLAGEGEPEIAAHLARLEERLREYSRLQVGTARQPSPEEFEALAALGYAGGVTTNAVWLEAMDTWPDASERFSEFERCHAAQTLMDAGEYDAAIHELGGVLEENPGNAWAQILTGQALASSGREGEAVQWYRRAAALRPDWYDPWRNLVRLHLGLDELEAALAAGDEALRIHPADDELRLDLAARLQDAGQLEKAEELLRAGLAVERRAPASGLELALARILYQRGEFEEGRQHLARAREMKDDAASRELAAWFARAQKDWAGLLAVHAGTDLTEASPQVHALRGEAFHRQGRIEDAVREYRLALSGDDTLDLAANNLAWALATDLGRPAEALPWAERALELRPEDLEYHDTYLEVLVRLGRTDQAMAHLSRLLESHPDDPDLLERARALDRS